jgi:hypothetical protein
MPPAVIRIHPNGLGSEVRHGADACEMLFASNSETKTHLTAASSYLPSRYCCPNQ